MAGYFFDHNLTWCENQARIFDYQTGSWFACCILGDRLFDWYQIVVIVVQRVTAHQCEFQVEIGMVLVRRILATRMIGQGLDLQIERIAKIDAPY